jgi:hypothetical protein
VASVPHGQSAPTVTTTQSGTFEDIPIPGLSVAARQRGKRSLAARLADPNAEWQTSHRMAEDSTMLVTASGRGDEPAHTIQYFRNGVLDLVVTQDWKPSWRGWDLVRRVTEKPDGSYRDVINVERRGGPDSGPMADLASSSLNLALSAGARTDDVCDDTDNPCQDKYDAWQEALSDAEWSAAEAAIICAFSPPPIDLIGCALATARAFRDARKADAKRDAYFACRRAHGLGETSLLPRTPIGGNGQLGGLTSRGNPRTASCDPPDSGGGGGDDGDVICYFYIEYDPVTGDVYSVTPLGCEFAS